MLCLAKGYIDLHSAPSTPTMPPLSFKRLYSYFLTAITMAMGTALLYSGVVGTFIDTLGWAKGFGMPTATEETAVLFASATGRNLGAGFFVWTQILRGDKRMLGMFMICWAWAGVADCMILWRHPDGQNVTKHMVNTVLAPTFGILLIRS